MFALDVGENGEILHATYAQFGTPGMFYVSALPAGDVTDYDYKDGQCVLNEARKAERIAAQEASENIPTQAEVLLAEIDYIAMMTGVEL